jgi:hypothetical protein
MPQQSAGRIVRLAGVGVAGQGFARAETFPARLRMAVPNFERGQRSLAKKPAMRVHINKWRIMIPL